MRHVLLGLAAFFVILWASVVVYTISTPRPTDRAVSISAEVVLIAAGEDDLLADFYRQEVVEDLYAVGFMRTFRYCAVGRRSNDEFLAIVVLEDSNELSFSALRFFPEEPSRSWQDICRTLR